MMTVTERTRMRSIRSMFERDLEIVPAQELTAVQQMLLDCIDGLLVATATVRLRIALPADIVYAGAEHLLLEHAKVYVPRLLPKPRRRGLKKGRMGTCYETATKVVLYQHWWGQSGVGDPDRYQYVEGFGCSRMGIPCPHAWVYDAEDQVAYDPTWNYGPNNPTVLVGVPISTQQLIDRLNESGYYGYLTSMGATIEMLRTPWEG